MHIQSLSTVTKAAWEWDISHVLNPVPFINDAIQLGVNRVFITASLNQIACHPQEYDEFIRLCNLNNIWVEALSGDATWGRIDGVRYLLDYMYEVFEFNNRHCNRFSAIHLDIEPHTGENCDWDINKESLMQQLIYNLTVARSLVDSHNKANNDALRLISVQPRWIWEVNVGQESCLPKIMAQVDEIAVMNYTRSIIDYVSNAQVFFAEAEKQGKVITLGSEFFPEVTDVTMAKISSDLLHSFYEVAITESQKASCFKQLAVHSLSAYKSYISGG